MNKNFHLICRALAFTGLTLLAACNASMTIPELRTFGALIDDSLLKGTISSAIEESLIDSADYDVASHVFNGIVLLLGYVQSQDEKLVVSQAVLDTLHVRGIHNELSIGGKRPLGTHLNDARLGVQVRAALINEPRIRIGHFNIVTYQGNVFLMGRVSRDEGQYAAEAASRVAGVRSVVKTLEYLN